MGKCILNSACSTRKAVKIDNIYLDIHNPRFQGEAEIPLPSAGDVFCPKNQEILRQHILRRYGANEIVDSIISVGFVPVDTIVVKSVGDNIYIVIEGNRRIAAIKTILGNNARKMIDIDTSLFNALQEIEVIAYDNDEISSTGQWVIQGIRHVSGVRSWGPYQQSLLIENLHNSGMNYREIANTIGIHYNKVSSMLKAYKLLQQMRNDSMFGGLASVNYFSHLEQAYLKIPVRDWLEYDEDKWVFKNIKNTHIFYKLITSKDENYRMSSRDVRDALPLIIQNKILFKQLVNNEITICEATFVATKKVIGDNAVEQLKLAKKCFADIRKMKFLSNEVRIIISDIKHEIKMLGV